MAASINMLPPAYHDDINLETYQLGDKLRESLALGLRITYSMAMFCPSM